MAFSFARFGNDLYTGKRSIDFVERWKMWLGIAGTLVLLSVLVLALKGINPGIEFRGGSEFRIDNVQTLDQSIATDVVTEEIGATEAPRVSAIGSSSIRVQTERLDKDQTDALGDRLAEAYGVSPSDVTSAFVGASWGADITRKALTGLVIFLVVVTIVMTIYFRAWQLAVASLVALFHDLVLTAGIYALVGFEVTPATVIAFLTILGYSLYDTVVVFDKVRENTAHVMSSTRRTYGEAVNLAVNQTLVRSINTTVVAVLPVLAILLIGAVLLGAGTLLDISLALLVGMITGAYSSIFIAPAVLVLLRRREPAVREQEAKVAKAREVASRVGRADEAAVPVAVGGAPDDEGTTPAASTSSTSASSPRTPRPTGPRNQPKRGSRQRPSGRKR
ncbi:protein translocase subunit SecF [Angustibacter speluncae]